MSLSHGSPQTLSIVPLGAGDLIDRAIRFYRKYFTTLFLIAAPPVVAGTLFSVGWLFLLERSFSPARLRPLRERCVRRLYLRRRARDLVYANRGDAGRDGRSLAKLRPPSSPRRADHFCRYLSKRLEPLLGPTVASAIIVVVLSLIGPSVFFVGAFVWLFIIGRSPFCS